MKRPLCWLALLFLLFLLLFIKQSDWKEAGIWESVQILEGRVAEKSKKENYYGEYWEITLKDVKTITEEGSCSLEGSYLIFLKDRGVPLLGQRVRVKADYMKQEEVTNQGQFDLGEWYHSMGILGRFQNGEILARGSSYSFFQETMWRIREESFLLLKKLLGNKDGALMAAMILGEKSGLEEESKSLYQRNGISHILAISGLHLTLLGTGFFEILKRVLPFPKIAAIVTGSFMIIYCIFTGGSVSAIRATIMFLLSLLGQVLNRSYDCLTALAASSVFLLFWNPYGLENSGFLLSFLAVIGVTYVAPILKEFLGIKGKLSSSLIISVSANLTTIPVLLCSYGTYPWYSILLNLFILPPMSVLLGMTVGLIFLSFFNSYILPFYITEVIQEGIVLGIKAILKYIEICCIIFEKMPFQDGYLGAPSLLQIVLYVFFLLFFLEMIRRKKFWGSEDIMKLLLLFLPLILSMSLRMGAEITMLDVGQGDCIVIRNAGGRVYISDCGSSSISQVGKYRLIPFLREKGYGRIEAVFLSHLDQDHCNGVIELLQELEAEKIKIKAIIFSEGVKEEKEKEEFQRILSLAQAQKIKIMYMKRGDRILDGGITFTCLHPLEKEGGNNGSLVLELEYGSFQMLLTGDVEEKGEEELGKILQNRSISYEVLKVAHHGSKGSSSKEFIDRILPKVSLISCGRNNSYGHPAKEVLERLEKAGSKVFDTRNCGAITIYPKKDGSFSIQTFLQP